MCAKWHIGTMRIVTCLRHLTPIIMLLVGMILFALRWSIYHFHTVKFSSEGLSTKLHTSIDKTGPFRCIYKVCHVSATYFIKSEYLTCYVYHTLNTSHQRETDAESSHIWHVCIFCWMFSLNMNFIGKIDLSFPAIL